jgi:hypothetical protein
MTFGYACDEATSFAILDRAAAGGITFMDTSDVCPLGGEGALFAYEGRIGDIYKGRYWQANIFKSVGELQGTASRGHAADCAFARLGACQSGHYQSDYRSEQAAAAGRDTGCED